MKRRLILTLAAASAIAGCKSTRSVSEPISFTSAVATYGDPATPTSAPAIRLPPITVEAAGAAKLVLIEQREVPLATVQVTVRGGSAYDPPDKPGLASFSVAMLEKGVAGRSAQDIAKLVDSLGATLSMGVDPDAATVRIDCLSQDVPAALDLLASLVREPTFDAAEMEKLRGQRIDQLTADRDDPRATLGRFAVKAIFGEHPYGHSETGTQPSLASFTRDDLREFHKTHFGSAGMVVTVSGDIDSSAVRTFVADHFGRLDADSDLAKIAPVAEAAGHRVLLVDLPTTTQSYFSLATIGPDERSPERDALDLLNVHLGGRFTSVLNQALRVESGLTYGAHSSFRRDTAGGAFLGTTFTGNDTLAPALELLFEKIASVRDTGLTQAQLDSARTYLKGELPTRYETASQLAAAAGALVLSGFEPKEITDRYARLDRVTLDEVNAAAKRYLPNDNSVLVIVGPAEANKPIAAKYGEVQVVPVTDPNW